MTAGEKPLGWLDTDLDGHLHYARGLVVLTDRRLIDVGPAEATAADRPDARGAIPVRTWPLTAIKGLRAKEHAGVGALELLGPESLLAHWRYTIGPRPTHTG